jgi:hypothetical protein
METGPKAQFECKLPSEKVRKRRVHRPIVTSGIVVDQQELPEHLEHVDRVNLSSVSVIPNLLNVSIVSNLSIISTVSNLSSSSAILFFSTAANLATILNFFLRVELPDLERLDCVELLYRPEHFEFLCAGALQRPSTKTFWK